MQWRWLGLGALAGAAALAWQRGRWEAGQLTLREERLTFPDLPAAFDGLRIAQVSDLHIPAPPTPGDAQTWRGAEVAQMCRGAGVDMIAVTGDLVKGGRTEEGGYAALRELVAVAPTYVVPGNEDYQMCEQDLGLEFRDTLARWEEIGAVVLRNRALPFERNGENLWLAGTDDSHEHRDDLPAALLAVPAGAFTILLSHSPDIIVEPVAGRARLILAGHTHGGQICLPGGICLWSHSVTGVRYAAGIHHVRASVLSVSRGIGAVNIPIRLFCLPEVVVLELHTA